MFPSPEWSVPEQPRRNDIQSKLLFASLFYMLVLFTIYVKNLQKDPVKIDVFIAPCYNWYR